MDVGLQLLQAFLVGDAEMLLLVDDEQAEIGEGDRFGHQRMGADDDADAAIGEARAHDGGFLRRDHARELRHPYRQSLEARRENPEMLAGEQGGGDHHRDLRAGHGGDEGGAQGNLRLAEADIAADQAVHRLAGGEILQHVGDGAGLVLGFGVGEAGAEFGEGAVIGGQHRGFAHLPLGGEADQAGGHVLDAVLGFGFAGLPGGAAEFVERNAVAFLAEAGEQVDVLDGEK